MSGVRPSWSLVSTVTPLASNTRTILLRPFNTATYTTDRPARSTTFKSAPHSTRIRTVGIQVGADFVEGLGHEGE